MEKHHPIPARTLEKRMAAFHYSVTATAETIPNTAVLTYHQKSNPSMDYCYLMKLVPCLLVDGKTIFPSDFKEILVEDYPGGVEAKFKYEDIEITTCATPLLYGRGETNVKGNLLFEIKTNPSVETVIYMGTDKVINMYYFKNSNFNNDEILPLNEPALTKEGHLCFKGGSENFHIIAAGSEKIELLDTPVQENEKSACIRFEKGSGHIIIGFSDNANDLPELINLDVKAEKEKVNEYYDDLFINYVETPEPVMNEAFKTAIYNLEYSWFEPIGWGECLHHWLGLWHMQVGAAADLIGQKGRSKSSILEHAYKLFENGAVPQFMPNKSVKRDFGGSNAYWMWQVRHYLFCSGDTVFAKEIIPYVDRVINQTLEECDKDGDMLVSWGLQIGNQEDFVANPYKGSVPSIELFNMFMTRAELSEILGDNKTASIWCKKAEHVKSLLYKELWIGELGRYAYYKDPTEVTMLDGHYETYIYPTIYNTVDDYDKYTSMRHLRDRLTGSDSAVYLSNNFSWHAYGTWGMQCGLAQQPWAAAGYNEAGLYNETWKPLLLMAEWAQDINHRGSWPEIGPEPFPAYFTPPAGLYIVAVIESLFGIRQDALKKHITITPSFPDHWPTAKLQTKSFEANYKRQGNILSYQFKNKDREVDFINYKVNWHLPVSTIKDITVNGKTASYELKGGMNHIILSFEVDYSEEILISFEYQTVSYSLQSPASLAEGEKLEVLVEGAVIKNLNDRCGVLDNGIIKNNDIDSEKLSGVLSSKIKNGFLDKYLEFNQLGQLNFSRRTFFLELETSDGVAFTAPIDITLLPRFEAVATGKLTQMDHEFWLDIKIRNNTANSYKKEGLLSIGSPFGVCTSVSIDLAARFEQIIKVVLPENTSSWLTAGDNKAILSLSNESSITITFNNEINLEPLFSIIPLQEKDMISDEKWNTLREMPGFPHIFFTFTSYQWPIPMYSYKDIYELKVPQIPGLLFKMYGQRFIPVSHLSGNASYKLPMDDKTYKKLYLMVLPFVDNHNIFAPVARVTAYKDKQIVYSRTLHYPGDVDYWVSDKNPTCFATVREERMDRFELLPILTKDKSDWEEGKPPVFPQPKWWSTSIPVVSESCIMSIIEINLSKPMKLEYLIFETIGVMPAFGIVSLTGELAE